MFSIVIPTRNRPDLADTTIARVLAQTWRDFEIIVLENSDQPSLGPWGQRDARIRVVSAPHTLSMPDNWERGLDLVRGDYVLYLADKDWLVPHALDELARLVAARSRPAMVNFRKATWIREEGLRMQQGTGRVATLPSVPVLTRWFSGVTHLHNAPMIHNSIVRRDQIDVVRARCGGRFFYGNSPDVASSLLLLANLPEYVVLDRIHVMAYFGPWSIGTASLKQGRQGAAARYAAEFATDPIAAAGLVWCLSGGIAETLMACQRADPERFASYQINWGRYLLHSWAELARRAKLGQDTSSDAALLRAGIGRLYSRTTWRRASLALLLRLQYRLLRGQTPAQVLAPVYARWQRMTGRLPGAPLDWAVTFLDGECWRPAIAIPTPEEAFEVILQDQARAVPDTVACTN
jgi:glycosyltransferase involved in cell wall biosynthesis